MTHTVISYYALTDAFRLQTHMRNGDTLEFVAIGRMRNLGFLALLRKIRALKSDRISVAIETENARPLAAPLLLVAAISGSRKISLLGPDGVEQPIARFRIASLFARVLVAQLSSRVAHRMAARELRTMEQSRPGRRPTWRGENRSILYLDANLAFGLAAGGSVGHTKGVIDGFIRNGFSVDYASSKPPPTEKSQVRWLRVAAVSLLAYPPELNHYPYNRQYDRHIEGWAAAKPYAFIYQRMSVHNFSGARLAKLLGIPLVLEFNGSEAWAAANWSEKLHLHDLAVQAERVSLRGADLVVTVSKVLGEEVRKAGVPPERIVVYPNCIDPQIFDPARFGAADRSALRERWSIPADALVATFIGTFGTWHGVDFLARAVRRLIDEDGGWIERNRLHFLFVGDGLKMPEVRQALAHAKFASFVTLTGLVRQSEAPAYLAASDIFLSPHLPNQDGSAFFGSPTKLFEYMAMERPIVASDLDQIGEVLRGNQMSGQWSEKHLAELFKPGDEDAFLAALRRVVDNPSASREMAHCARRAALATYTWDHHVAAILARMQELGLR